MVFVTGGTGFIGAYIIRKLVQAGYRVRACRRSASLPAYIEPEIWEAVEWVETDILDSLGIREAVEGASAVIHAAGKVSFYGKEKKQMFATNINGTANIVNACIELKAPRLIHISSVAAIGRTVNGATVSEEKKWENHKNNTPYAISKYYAEMEVWRGIAEGLNAVILNPGTVLGYGNWHQSSCSIFKSVYNEFPWYTNGINGFVDVEDIALVCEKLLHSEIENERFILTGDNWPFREIFNHIADGLGKKRPHKYAGPLAGSIAWRVEKLKSVLLNTRPLLTKETAKVAHTVTYFNNSKILTALKDFQFTPLDVSIKNATRQYLMAVQNGLLKS